MRAFGREEILLFVCRATLLSEILPTDILEDGEAEGVEQEVPGLVFFLYEAAGFQAESVSNRASQQQNIYF